MSIEQAEQNQTAQEPSLGGESLELVLSLMARGAAETAAIQNSLQDILVEESRQLALALLRTRAALESVYALAKDDGDYKIESIVGPALYATDNASYVATAAAKRNWSGTKD